MSLPGLFCRILCVYLSLFMPIHHFKFDLNKSELYALNAVLIEGKTGEVLFDKNAYDKKPNASTTKIMTCILALECGQMDDEVQVSGYAAKMPEVRLGVKEGEVYRLEDLLYSLMLESHNDSAVVIAENIGGSTEAFSDMMNKKAKEIGCTNTYFITPNGLDANKNDKIHGTSALDLALIMRYCIYVSPKKDDFIKICQTGQYSFSEKTKGRSFVCTNHNALLHMEDGVIAGKTGFTCDAGYCYVGAFKYNDEFYVFSLLGSGWPGNRTYKWKDSSKLIEYARGCHENKTDKKYVMPQDIKADDCTDTYYIYTNEKDKIDTSPAFMNISVSHNSLYDSVFKVLHLFSM